jgi:hypothetical protein
MANEWRPEELWEERISRDSRNVFPLGLDGRSPNPVPLTQTRRDVGASVRGTPVAETSSIFFNEELLKIEGEAPASTYPLEYKPMSESLHCTANSVPREFGTEFTFDGSTLTVLPAMGLDTAHRLWVRYAVRQAVAQQPSDGDYVSEVLADGPWLYWRGKDSAYPTMPDFSGNGRDGSWDSGLYAYHGLPSIVGGMSDGESWNNWGAPGSAVDVERPGYADADLSDLSGVPLSVEVWCDPTAIPQPGENSTGGLWELATDTFVRISDFGAPSNQLQFEYRGTRITANVMTDDIQHIVATVNTSGAMKLYRNNTLVVSGTGPSGGLPVAPSFFRVGSNYNGVRHFDGSLQEAALYLTELSAARVGVHYSVGSGP